MEYRFEFKEIKNNEDEIMFYIYLDENKRSCNGYKVNKFELYDLYTNLREIFK